VTSHVTGNGTYSICLSGSNDGTGQSFTSSEGTNKPVLEVTYGDGNDVTAPAAPANLTAVGGASKILLNWDNNTEEDLASYSVYRSTTSGSYGSPIATGVATSDYNDTAVSNGTVYYYVVTAVDTSDNESADSSETAAMPEGVVKSIDFCPTDDALVNHNQATLNYGTAAFLAVRADGTSKGRNSFLKFTVTDVTGTVVAARLKMYSQNVTQSVTAKAVSNTSWTEGAITWNNQPTIGSTLDTVTPSAGALAEFDVTSHVTGNGTYSICLQGSNNNTGESFTSKEGTPVNAPVLEVTYAE
jgi:hypothetical protein